MALKNSGPENPLEPQKGPSEERHGFDANREGKKHIESQSKSELNNLKESVVHMKEAGELLKNSDWLGNGEKLGKKKSETSQEKQTPFGSAVGTDHVSYFSRSEPNRRIGVKPLSDVTDFSVGVVDSLATTAKLAGHVVVDAFRFVRNPVRQYRETRDILEDNIV